MIPAAEQIHLQCNTRTTIRTSIPIGTESKTVKLFELCYTATYNFILWFHFVLRFLVSFSFIFSKLQWKSTMTTAAATTMKTATTMSILKERASRSDTHHAQCSCGTMLAFAIWLLLLLLRLLLLSPIRCDCNCNCGCDSDSLADWLAGRGTLYFDTQSAQNPKLKFLHHTLTFHSINFSKLNMKTFRTHIHFLPFSIWFRRECAIQ